MIRRLGTLFGLFLAIHSAAEAGSCVFRDLHNPSNGDASVYVCDPTVEKCPLDGLSPNKTPFFLSITFLDYLDATANRFTFLRTLKFVAYNKGYDVYQVVENQGFATLTLTLKVYHSHMGDFARIQSLAARGHKGGEWLGNWVDVSTKGGCLVNLDKSWLPAPESTE